MSIKVKGNGDPITPQLYSPLTPLLFSSRIPPGLTHPGCESNPSAAGYILPRDGGAAGGCQDPKMRKKQPPARV